MIITQGSIPEVKEDHIGDCLNERASKIRTFQDLGPPDLVALTKSIPNQKNTEVGTYLYYTGLDNSSSSAVAAHLNQLANVIGAKQQLWFNKPKHFKVTQAVYCSYNAFSRCDVVVACHLPGNVDTHVIDARGDRVPETDAIWTEVFASAIIRSVLTPEEDDEQVHNVVESRNLDPFYTPALAKQFILAFGQLFFQGTDVGCAPEIQSPTLINNYLVDAFLKVVKLTDLYDDALEVLMKLREKEESVVSLIVKVLLMKDEEVKAVKMLYEGIKKNPRDASLLSIQSQFLVEKGKLDMALSSAIRAVNCAPSEFNTWANLSKVYLEMGKIEECLLTLNSCPMAAYKEKFHLKRIISASAEKMHLPLPTDVSIPEVAALDSTKVAQEHNAIDQSLMSLQAANLKSTFARAYEILTEVVNRTGWEALLKFRAKIFVMEEEYQTKSSKSSIKEIQLNGNGATIGPSSSEVREDGFRMKRLCERWLDNLFMLLYDDLKTYTMWQAEMIHFQAQKTVYEKIPLEWELLGMCAFRLHHYKEAAGAFQNCLNHRFSPSSTRNLLKYYIMESKSLKKKATKTQKTVSYPVQNGGSNGGSRTALASEQTPLQLERKLLILDDKILDCVIRLLAWNHRWYSEFSPYLVLVLADVVERQGLTKVKNELTAKFPEDSGAGDLLNDTFLFLKMYGKPGSDI